MWPLILILGPISSSQICMKFGFEVFPVGINRSYQLKGSSWFLKHSSWFVGVLIPALTTLTKTVFHGIPSSVPLISTWPSRPANGTCVIKSPSHMTCKNQLGLMLLLCICFWLRLWLHLLKIMHISAAKWFFFKYPWKRFSFAPFILHFDGWNKCIRYVL